jgi:myosin heavy subunit
MYWLVGAGDLLMEIDGRDVSNFDVKQVKEMTKGPPGSPMKLKAQRGGKEYEVLLERSGGTGTSMASISDASSMQGNATGVLGKEMTASERGREGTDAAMALHEELDKLRASLATMTGELSKTKEELQGQAKESTEASKTAEKLEKELAISNSKLAEFTQKASDLQAAVDEANQKLLMASKSGDERVVALEQAQKEMTSMMQEQKKMAEKQAWDLEEAQTALRALHGAVCKQGPAPVLGGIGIALGVEAVSSKGKPKKMVKVTQIASSGPAAKAGVKSGIYVQR